LCTLKKSEEISMRNDQEQQFGHESKEETMKNRVIVRIWTSLGNPKYPGKNVGHVSVQTPNIYVSLWPMQATEDGFPSAKTVEGWGVTAPISSEFVVDYEKDKTYEGRPPEVIYCFYTLDTAAIEYEFADLKERLKGWALFGHLVSKNAQSCASLAYQVLLAGGIKRLLSHGSSIMTRGSALSSEGFFASGQAVKMEIVSAFSSRPEAAAAATLQSRADSLYCVEMLGAGLLESPDQLALLLQNAKRRELEIKPITRQIEYLGEQDEHETPIEKAGGCTIL